MNLSLVKEFYFKYKLFVYPIALGVASLILIVLVIVPQIRAFIEGQTSLQVIDHKAKVLDAKAAQLNNIDSTDLENKLNLAVQSLPIDKDYGSIIGLIQRIAAESGVTISSLSLTVLAGEKTPGFAVKLDILGPKQAIDRMIQNIEKSPRVMKISNLDITSANLNGAIGAQLTINAFYQTPPKDLGSIETELPELSAAEQEILTNLASSTVISPAVTSTQLLPRGKANPFQ